MQAVVLAGGKGRRLQPYTAVFPKPLVPLGERPILEIVVRQLRQAGFDRLTFAVGHLAGLIQAYFGDGSRFGVGIEYALEETPLGTAGPLGLIRRPDDDFLVMNGDILTDLSYADMMTKHRASSAIASVATYRKPLEITLGVLEIDAQDTVKGYTEKPTVHYDVSCGIYCFRPTVCDHVERGKRLDLPDLVLRLIQRGEIVRAHKFDGFWLDIGRPEDYEVAQAHAASGRFD